MRRATGILLIIVSAASFGTLAIFGRYAYAAGLDTPTLLFLRFTLSAILLAGLLALRHEKLPQGRTLSILVGMGALGYVGQSFCYLTAIKLIPAGLVALLLYLYPTFVAILSIIFLKEKLTILKSIALALATLGAVLTANPQSSLALAGQAPASPWLGILLAVGGAVIYVVIILLAAWLFGEALLPVSLVGGGLILSAVALLTRSELRASPAQPRQA